MENAESVLELVGGLFKNNQQLSAQVRALTTAVVTLEGQVEELGAVPATKPPPAKAKKRRRAGGDDG